LVERLLWEQEVAGSNPVTPIEKAAEGGFFNREERVESRK